jgi:hypothetical protein
LLGCKHSCLEPEERRKPDMLKPAMFPWRRKRHVRDQEVKGAGPEATTHLRHFYATSGIFIFQLIIGLALTNTAYLFFTSSTTSLRPISSYTAIEVVLFAIQVAFATARIFEHSVEMQFNVEFYYPKARLGAVLFIIDTFFAIVEGLMFYLLGFTIRHVSENPLPYFYFIGAIIATDVLAAMVSLAFTRDLLTNIKDIIDVVATLVLLSIGYVAIRYNPPYLVTVLVSLTVVRVVLDYLLASGVHELFVRKR